MPANCHTLPVHQVETLVSRLFVIMGKMTMDFDCDICMTRIILSGILNRIPTDSELRENPVAARERMTESSTMIERSRRHLELICRTHLERPIETLFDFRDDIEMFRKQYGTFLAWVVAEGGEEVVTPHEIRQKCERLIALCETEEYGEAAHVAGHTVPSEIVVPVPDSFNVSSGLKGTESRIIYVDRSDPQAWLQTARMKMGLRDSRKGAATNP